MENKRIEELADKAGRHRTEFGYGRSCDFVIWGDINIEKFADLIIKECLECAQPDDSYQDDWFKAKVDVCKRIEEKFGVSL
jgi:hypothetical protein